MPTPTTPFRQFGGIAALLCIVLGAGTALTQNALTNVGKPAKPAGVFSNIAPAEPTPVPESPMELPPISLPPPWVEPASALPIAPPPQPKVKVPGSILKTITPPAKPREVPMPSPLPPVLELPPPQTIPPMKTPVEPALPPHSALHELPPLPGTSDAPAAPATPAVPVESPDPLTNLDILRQPPAPRNGPGADGTPLNDVWRSGIRFESADKAFSIFFGGRFQFDVVDYLTTTAMRQNIPGTTPLEDGVSFRRMRFDMGGTIYRNFEYYAQVDFANGFLSVPNSTNVTNATYPTDMWVQFVDLPWIGTVRIGNQKPLYSFEHLTSSRFLNFLERSLGFDAFAEGQNNGFEPGITVLNTYADKRGTWGVGVFKYTRSPFGWNVGRNESEVNGRVTYLPVYEDGGRYLVHVGLGAASRDLDQDQARYRSRLDARNSPSTFSPLVADTGLFFGSGQQILIPEFVFVAGPLSFQSEYYASWVEHTRGVGPNNTRLADQGTTYFQSVYAEAHLFLTGEHREYNRDSGVFTRVVPRRPVAWTHCGFTGCGAWQVTARYSYLDLNSKGISGGQVHDMTIGLNWFLNPNMKLQGNYFLAARNAAGTAGDGLIHGFAMRTAIDF